MKKPAYRQWLERKYGDSSTVSSRFSGTERIEKCYEDLDEHYEKDQMASLIRGLNYSKYDKQHNPLRINGDIRNGLATCLNATRLYKEFRDSASNEEITSPLISSEVLAESVDNMIAQRFGLERDMQAALRIEIAQLEPGLAIIDDGAERSVDSGFIDITARDAANMIVVIELKAGRAGRDAIGQILSYMGDIAAEEDEGKVRGILVASDFDGKAKAAAKMVPNLILRKYSVQFSFSDGQE
jgi:hypothetical protein